MVLLRPDGELPGRLFGPGADATDHTGTPRRVVKTDAHPRPASDIASGRPFDTGVALGTPRLLGGPIPGEGLESLAFAGLMLPALGAKRRTAHLNLVQALGPVEELGIHRATVEYLGAREEITLG